MVALGTAIVFARSGILAVGDIIMMGVDFTGEGSERASHFFISCQQQTPYDIVTSPNVLSPF